MRDWALLLGGLTIWFAHFLTIYGFGLIFPGTELARILTLVVTVPALAANALLLWAMAAGTLVGSDDELDRWVREFAALGAGLSFIAVVWQALPALMV